MACTRRCAKFGPREQALARQFPDFPRMLNLICVAMTPDLPTVACALNRGPDGCTSYWTMRAGGPIPIWLREGLKTRGSDYGLLPWRRARAGRVLNLRSNSRSTRDEPQVHVRACSAVDRRELLFRWPGSIGMPRSPSDRRPECDAIECADQPRLHHLRQLDRWDFRQRHRQQGTHARSCCQERRGPARRIPYQP